jgi:hypothetical protein
MKNTTSQKTRYPVPATLRVAFRSVEIVEVKESKAGKSKKQAEQVKKSQAGKDLPQFDDYRIKARDHDPL